MIGRWTLQLAAAGARDRGVFEAAAAACLRAIARGMATKAAGSSKGTKGCILNLGLIFPLFLLRAGCHRLPPQACDVIVLLFFPCFFFFTAPDSFLQSYDQFTSSGPILSAAPPVHLTWSCRWPFSSALYALRNQPCAQGLVIEVQASCQGSEEPPVLPSPTAPPAPASVSALLHRFGHSTALLRVGRQNKRGEF